jgi:hypothetical protein
MKALSERAAKTEAKRIHEVVMARLGGEPKTRDQLSKIVDQLERGDEIYAWNIMAAGAMGVFFEGGPKWSYEKKTKYVEDARDAVSLVRYHLRPYIDAYKDRFVESAAEWARTYGSRKTRKGA